MARPKQDSAYWRKRIKAEQKYMEQATNVDEIVAIYQAAVDDIQEKIDAEYTRLDQLGLDVQNVKQVDVRHYESEAKALVAQANKIRKELGRNATRADFTKAVNDRMRIYNATMRINRLEYLKARTGLSLINAGVKTIDQLNADLQEKYVDEYKRQAGILGETYVALSAKKVMEKVHVQIKGATFSSRIWQNTDELKAQLDVLLTNNRLRGESPDKLAKQLRNLVNTQFADQAKYVTERLARTEVTRVIGEAQKDSYRKYGIEYVKWIAEASACDHCEDLSHGGKNGEGVYKLGHEPAYPAHPNCRCSLAGYYEPDE